MKRVAAISTRKARSPPSALIRRRCATTRPPLARPSSSLARCWRYRDFLYFFIGEFLGGGLVLDGALRPGRTGNAAALGSMPIMAKSDGGVAPQLIACASIYQLERRLEAAGIDASSICAAPESWGEFGPQLDGWIEDAASALAYAIGRGDLRHRFRGDRDRRRDAGGGARAPDRPYRANLRRPRSARLERRRDCVRARLARTRARSAPRHCR